MEPQNVSKKRTKKNSRHLVRSRLIHLAVIVTNCNFVTICISFSRAVSGVDLMAVLRFMWNEESSLKSV